MINNPDNPLTLVADRLAELCQHENATHPFDPEKVAAVWVLLSALDHAQLCRLTALLGWRTVRAAPGSSAARAWRSAHNIAAIFTNSEDESTRRASSPIWQLAFGGRVKNRRKLCRRLKI